MYVKMHVCVWGHSKTREHGFRIRCGSLFVHMLTTCTNFLINNLNG